MMNSSVGDDPFGDNPFRSDGGNTQDVFFDTQTTSPPPSTDPLQQPMQQQQQQPPPLQQQMQQPPQPQVQQQQPPPQQFQQPVQNFAAPSGPMMTMQQQQAGAGGGQQEPAVNRSWWQSCVMALTLDTYKAYFDIDAEDIVIRVRAVVRDFHKPEHFRKNVLGVCKGTSTVDDGLKGPDLYGPFWITMTLIFLIGVTANMHHYLYHDSDAEQEFEYDINHLLHAGSALCGYTFALPSILWLTTYCMNLPALQLVEWVSLYGYSLVPFIPAVMLCIIPLWILPWIFLLGATFVSLCLIMRNAAPALLSRDIKKAPPVILCIVGMHVVFFFIMKFRFYTYHQPS